MERDYRNIYRYARKRTGFSQEYWAEMIGVSADAVRQYEAGRMLPSDDVALAMSEVAGWRALCYRHLIQKSLAAQKILPELQEKTLPEAVLSLLCRVEDFSRGGLEDLKRLAADGRISADEVVAFGEALAELREMIGAAYELQYAREAE